MSDDQLPDELGALFAAERTSPAGDPEARAKIHARLAGVVALLPAKAAAATGSAATTATALGMAGKIISVVALTVGIGVTAATVMSRASAPATAEIPPFVAPEAPFSSPPATAQIAQHEPTPEVRAPVAHVARTVSARTAAPTPPPPSEAKLLRRAWAALAADDARLALELVTEAEHLHPSGALLEERAALRIQTLAKLGSLADARSAAETFAVQFPDSVHRTRIDRALSSEASP